MVGMRAPLEILECALESDPNLVHVKNAKNETLLDVATKGGRIAPGVFARLFRGQEHLAEELYDNESTMLHRSIGRLGGAPNLEMVQAIYAANPSAALSYNTFGNLPIHGCRRVSLALPIIQFLVPRHPELLSMPNKDGKLLLHLTLEQDFFGTGNADETLDYLLQAYPAALLHSDNKGNVPLNTCSNRVTLPILERLLSACPQAARAPNQMGYYSLHTLMATWANNAPKYLRDVTMHGDAQAFLRKLVEAFPDALKAPTLTPSTSASQGTTLITSAGQVASLTNSAIEKNEDDDGSSNMAGFLPLHLACRSTHQVKSINKWMIQTVVEAFPEAVRTPTKTGVLPFHIFCTLASSDLDTLHYLADQYPESISMPDHRGSLPVQLACGNREALEWLLSKHPEAICQANPVNGDLPIHAYIARRAHNTEGHDDPTLNFLIELYPESLLIPGKSGCLPLHCAVLGDHAKNEAVIFMLLEKCPEAASVPSDDGRMAFHVACLAMRPKVSVIDALLKPFPGAIRIPTNNGYLGLHAAIAARNNLSFIKAVYERYPGAISVATSDGRLPLHIACEYRCDLDVIQFLTEKHSAAMTTESACGRLPIHYPCVSRPAPARAGSIGGGKYYPENEAADDPSILLRLRHVGSAHEGKFNGRYPIPGQGTVEWILQEFPQVASRADADGWTPLHAACANGTYEAAIDALLSCHPQAAQILDKEMWLPLHLCVSWGHPREIILTRIGRDPPSFEEWKKPLRFDYNPHCKKSGIADKLLAAYPDAIKQADETGWLPLHCAIASGSLTGKGNDLLEKYINAYPQAFAIATREEGFLPLHILSGKRHVDSNVFKSILKQFPEAWDAKDKAGRTPMDIFKEKQHDSFVRDLSKLRDEALSEL